MKIRSGFVSNSSSSSYIIQKKNLTDEQIDMIHNHVDYCYELLAKEEKSVDSSKKFTEEDPYGEENWDEEDGVSIDILKSKLRLDWGGGVHRVTKRNDGWHTIKENDDMIHLGTTMDNFDMCWFLIDVVGVNMRDFRHKEY